MTELDTIIQLHEKLIYKIAAKFHDIDKEDLYQSGVIGIIKAYNNYKPTEETKFTTYAYNYIFGEMYEFANNMRSIKLNKNILKIYKKIEQAKYLLAQKSGHYPSSLELSTYLGIEETVINEIQNATTTIMSLDNDTERTIYETISSPKDSINQDSLDLQDSIKNLTPKEQDIINYRYFKDYTQSETAQILGMSQVTVSRYEKKSLTKMYNYLNI
jgi:RNA polymerase sporulation-specific sigma factor